MLEVAGLLGEECFSPIEVWDAAVEAGVAADVMDSAGYLSVVLAKVERGL